MQAVFKSIEKVSGLLKFAFVVIIRGCSSGVEILQTESSHQSNDR